MSKTILAQVDGWTPVIDAVVQDVGLMCAVVFGKAWRYCQMSDGVCKASQERIADELGLSRATINSYFGKLVEAEYLEDITPDLVGLPHQYRDTGKAGLSISFTGNVSKNLTPTSQKSLHPPVKNLDTKIQVKKQDKKELREREQKPLSLDFANMSQKEASEVPTLALFKQATDFFPGSPIWQYVHETIEIHGLTVDRIKAANEAWCAQDFKRGNVRGILEWAVNGIPPQYELRKPFTPTPQRAQAAKVTEPKAFEAIRRFRQKQEAINVK